MVPGGRSHLALMARPSQFGFRSLPFAPSVAVWSVSACLGYISAQDHKPPVTTYSGRVMADGKQWTTRNLELDISPSYCYDDAELNCHRYGRLYTWESARRVCQALGDSWRLPTDAE